MKHVCHFVKEKETRGTLRFKESTSPGVPPVIGTLYVKKWAIPLNTQNVIVTVEIPEVEGGLAINIPVSDEPEPIVGDSYPTE